MMSSEVLNGVAVIIISIILFSYVKGHQGDCECVPFRNEPACGCKLSNGKTIDLGSLGSQNDSAAFKTVCIDQSSKLNITFYYNPCFSFTGPPNCDHASICAKFPSVSAVTVATQESVKFETINNSIVINYDKYASVVLKCGHGSSNLSCTGTLQNGFLFTLTTEHACVGSLTSCNDYATIYIATGFSAAAAIILVTVIIVLISCIIYRNRCKPKYEPINDGGNNNNET